MNRKSILLFTLVASLVLAGCASNEPPTETTTTTTTTTTTSTPPTSSTPVITTAPPPLTNNSTEQPPAALDCPEPADTPAANASARLGYPEHVYTVNESSDDGCLAFVGASNTTAGWTAITLRNDGRQPHIMPMYRVPANTTRDEVAEALASGDEPAWMEPQGGVGFVTPFSSGTVLMNLTEGRYLLVCYFNGHHMQGMYRFLDVGAAEGEALPEPTANFTIEMRDFSFVAPTNVTPGLQVVAFTNNGMQPHEAPLIKLNNDTNATEFLGAVENPNAQGPPPGSGVGGVNVVAPGKTVYGIVDFVADTSYAMVCFVESPQHGGAPHIALGMVAEFEVGPAE